MLGMWKLSRRGWKLQVSIEKNVTCGMTEGGGGVQGQQGCLRIWTSPDWTGSKCEPPPLDLICYLTHGSSVTILNIGT